MLKDEHFTSAGKMILNNFWFIRTGNKRHMRVSIYFKRKQLILSLEKKFLGVLTTLKKCKIYSSSSFFFFFLIK